MLSIAWALSLYDWMTAVAKRNHILLTSSSKRGFNWLNIFKTKHSMKILLIPQEFNEF